MYKAKFFDYAESKHFWETNDGEWYFGYYRTVVKNHDLHNHSGIYLYRRKLPDDDYSRSSVYISNFYVFH